MGVGMISITHTEQILKQEKRFLDTLELDSYLDKDWSLEKIMNEIQEDHGSEYKEESYIFNAMTPNDFMKYVKERYKDQYNFYMYTEIRSTVAL